MNFPAEFSSGRTATDRPSPFHTQLAEGMSEDDILGELFEAMHPDAAGAVYESYEGKGEDELQDSLDEPALDEGAEQYDEPEDEPEPEPESVMPRGNTPVSAGDGEFSDGGLVGTSPTSRAPSVRGGGTPAGSVRSMSTLQSSHIGAHHAQPWESAMAVSARSPSNASLPASRGSMRGSMRGSSLRKDPYLASPAISPKPKKSGATQNASHVRSASGDVPYSPPMTRSRARSRGGSEYGGSQGSGGSSGGFVSLKRQVEEELKAQADERWARKKAELDADQEELEAKLERLQIEKGMSKTDAQLSVYKLKPWEQSKRNREFDERIARNQAEREEVDKLMAANRARRQKAQAEHDEWKMKFEAAERRRKADQEFALQEALKQQRAELWEHRAQKEREEFKEKCHKDADNALKKKQWKEETDRISLEKEMRMKKASYRAPLAYDIAPVGKRFEKSKPFRRQIKEALKQREESIRASSAGSVESIKRDYLSKYSTRSPSAAGISRSGTAFDRVPTFGMTARHDSLTRSLVGKPQGSTMGRSDGSLTKLSPARRGLGSSGGSDYAADDYLRNKDEHGLTRDDLDDLGYPGNRRIDNNNPHAQYDE